MLRILHLIPGTGGTFYCENCLRDASLVQGLRQIGHDVVMVPMYLPILFEEPGVDGQVPVFFGAINVYLKQISKFYRHVPRWVERVFDTSGLLKLVAKNTGSTSAHGLEEMTLSMLRGEHGNQASELDAFIRWIKTQEKPHAVHLSNALLLGMARRIKHELDIPIICSLQDEHTWLDQMKASWAKQIWDTMIDRGRDVDAYITVSSYYADIMQQRMQIPDDRLHIIPAGVNLDGFHQASLDLNPPIIGYLSRICATHGLDILVEAFIQLRKNKKLRHTQLHITGGQLGEDKAFIRSLKKKLQTCNCQNEVHVYSEFDRPRRLEFLQSLSVLSVPMHEPEALGLFQLEAMAAGVPVVQPRIGGFTELIEATGGGILYEPNNPATLAVVLEDLLLDQQRLKALGNKGHTAVVNSFSHLHMAEKVAAVYEKVKGK
ncbi:glycosyltransferase family 4 protein [candidate division KSB1 bacterium]|nr:glycosyltransferase family 4 protein [candidate division KSB1 bacterium]